MLQKDHLFEWRTIYRNITLGLELQRRRPNAHHASAGCRQTGEKKHFQAHGADKQSLRHVDQMLNDYDLYRFRSAKPSELSGGMRQRAAFIRTLAPDPDLLLLDEPFSALDFQTRLSVCNDVAAILRREKKTALLVTHDLSEALSMADRVIVLTRRPARIQSVLEVTFSQKDLTPLERRSAPEFQGYFNYLWKELNPHES